MFSPDVIFFAVEISYIVMFYANLVFFHVEIEKKLYFPEIEQTFM